MISTMKLQSQHSRQLLARAALTAFLGLSVVLLAAPPAFAEPSAPAPQSVGADARAVLAQYGRFVQHERYGEVWLPTVTPAGWHPYPACHWVHTQRLGWYFDDKSAWGRIVHHYGRWTNDARLGWMWVPGAEFSPGWVVWRSSDKWIGWAPMPPEADVGLVSADEFDNSSRWTFIEAAKMRAGCSDGVVAGAALVPLILRETRYVTAIEYVDGIAIFVLPPAIIGPIVVIDIDFAPWPLWFLTQIVFDWNWVWSNINVVVNVNSPCGPACPPGQLCP
jgi:hypothetical protein